MENRRKRRKGGRFAALFSAVCLLAALTGCAGGGTKDIVLTTGFHRNEVFRLADASCSLPEVMIYLTTEQNLYESVYGDGIWSAAGEDGTLEERLKENVLAKLSQIKAMTLLAGRRGVTLEEQEETLVREAAVAYRESLNETEKQRLGVTQELAEGMYRDYALADKVYREIISDINPEISDDEARTITVQHILIRTVTHNADGTTTPFSEKEKERCHEEALRIRQEAASGEAFESLIEKYSDAGESTISFGKGEMEAAFEEAAFNLGTDEISEVVETREGYEIIKCISTFNREETDRNKEKIAEQRRDEVFGQEYDAFVDSLPRNLNEALWESVTLIRDKEVDTDSFFAVYQEYFHPQEREAAGGA
ncbi:MAG TPA: peptidylprolyl isomerase [Candidatus Eisenbergiella intestinipullorum]|nr:peptidylprolyl isomerase [Candidatus Eisenbergiella intestinipullorum]